jgi:pyridoxine 5-phosphate synthase
MTKLSVNVNKVATLRNARGGNMPNVVQFALDCERFGADGITVHPRPDERHITRNDTRALSKVLTTELNIEGYPDPIFMALVAECQPKQATLVPDPPGVLTSSAGWNVKENIVFLKEIVSQLKRLEIRVSLFIDTDLENIALAASLGIDRIELYTGPFAEQYESNPAESIEKYVEASLFASSIGLEINAGHDLSLQNLAYFKSNIPLLSEVSIGHALLCDSLYLGIENTIQLYKKCLVS